MFNEQFLGCDELINRIVEEYTEIGSEFHFIPFHSGNENNYTFNVNDMLLNYGRTAIRFLMESLQSAKLINGIILPDYLCESIIQPIKDIGIPYEFYKIDKNLQVVLEDLNNTLKPGWAVFVLDYFNVKLNDKTVLYLQNIKGTNIIIEDITHSLFDQKEPLGHFQIASIRKWLGIPSGALIRDFNNEYLQKQVSSKTCKTNASVVQKRFYAAVLKKMFLENQLVENDKSEFLELFQEAEIILDESNVEVQAIDSISRKILNSHDFRTMEETRKKNYRTLYNQLKEVQEVEILNGMPDSKKVPLGFPIKIYDRDKLRSALIDENIYPPVHWPLPKELLIKQSDDILDISKTILTLPCDQRYNEIDMNRMVNVIIKHYCR